MRINILALIIGMSTISFAPQLLAKEVSYGQQKIVYLIQSTQGMTFTAM
nr:hypothetical protein [Providencia sp. G1(2023)]